MKNLLSLTYPKGPVPEDEDVGGAVGIDGAGVNGLGGGSVVGLDCVGGVGGDDDFGVVVVDDDDDGKMHEPVPIHNSEQPVKNGH